MKQFFRVSEAAAQLGVCVRTIQRWDACGKIKCHRTVGGHRRISLFEIKRLLNTEDAQAETKQLAIYARVSSYDQKKRGDLQRQIEIAKDYCQTQGVTRPLVFSDVASGLKTKRPGLLKLCKKIEQGEIKTVVVTYPDRLTRFGLDYLDQYFHTQGTSLHILHQPPTQSMEEELVEDLVAIVTAFSGRVHGMRSHKNTKKKITKAKTSKKVLTKKTLDSKQVPLQVG
ncbi:MAG: IS607 family transposase [Candidatus Hodarchaeales archaeon]|jgi:excisionase family DNA binding protein